MNILYYLWRFPKLSESFILNEIYELEQRGHNVAVCALYNSEKEIQHEEYSALDIPVHHVETPKYRNVVDAVFSEVTHPALLKQLSYWASPKDHLANLVRTKWSIDFVDDLDWEIDHIHTHFAKVSQFVGRYLAAYYDVPFTITTHARDLYRNPVGRYTGSLLRSADRIVTVSEYNKRHIRREFVRNTPIDVVRAGIRPGKFSPKGSVVENRILTVSRLVDKKGVPYALEAISLVAEEIPDVEYHIVGTGELHGELVRSVDELGIEDNVTFLNTVDDERLLTEYDEARCFLLPCVIAESGDRDGIPVVLMEAMSMKTPPVSTTVSGICELVEHEQNGLTVDPRDSEALSEAVIRLLRNDNEWTTYREAAREKVLDDFNITREIEKLEATFEAAQSSE